MSALEKVAYLKGLIEGMGIDASSNEGKIYSAVVDTLDAIAAEVDALGENALDLAEEIDALSEDLGDIEEVVFGDDDFEDWDDDDCDCCDDDDEDCDCGCCGDDLTYQIDCPSCEEKIEIDEDALAAGSIICPKCGEKLEFEFDDDEEDDD